ncbi:hypothetical protein GCM10009534_28810 [Kribbella sandramycini]
MAGLAGVEPDVELAKLWWPNPRNVWTPIGWKDHLFRFNVTYNGSVVGAPQPLARMIKHFEGDPDDTRGYRRDRLQLDFTPWGGPAFTKEAGKPRPMRPLYNGHFYVYREDDGLYGRGMQRWADSPTPVLQTDWTLSEAGLVLRQSVFAHVLNTADVVTGQEQLFAWIRLSVIAADSRLVNANHDYGFAIRVARAYYTQELPYNFQDGIVLTGFPELAPFVDGRDRRPITVGGKTGFAMWGQRGPQLAVLAASGTPVPVFSQPDTTKAIFDIEARLKPEVGSHIDILQCMQAVNDDGAFKPELALGFDGALAKSNEYWSRKASTAATIRTPEKYVNDFVTRNVQFSEVVACKVPGTNYSTFLTGSMGYDVLWTTPTSMTSHMFLSLLGHHDTVAKHLELYKATQGSVKPPGPPYYVKHEGYFATPSTVTAVDWLPDHGAVMTAVATHALMTGDQAFINAWLPNLLRACDWIKDVCALTNHDGIKGLPPAADASDESIPVQSIWATAWIYKGLATTIRLLKRLNHARVPELTAFAAGYQAKASQALDTAGASAPKWRHPDGNDYPIYSHNFHGPAGAFGEAMRLDAGAMVMVWAGLLPATDPRMVKYCDYFRVGPNVKLWNGGSRKHPLDAPILEHEISSFEPIYSWNLFHSWQLGDRARFLEGMYSLAVGGVSPQTYIPFEHRGGMSASLGTHATIFSLMRLAVVDDQLHDADLNLLRLCPMAWLSTDEDTVFDKMPTVYGPISLKFRRTGASQLTLTWTATWRSKPARLLVHAPPGFTTLVINGTTHSVPAAGYVVIAT